VQLGNSPRRSVPAQPGPRRPPAALRGRQRKQAQAG
jgi:hypothetical protein